MPHLVVTAGNDQHLRIWDVRHMSKIQPRAVDRLTPPPDVKGEGEDVKPHFDTHPTSVIPNEMVERHVSSAKGKGMLRASYQHGKSCSSAYWDPWGRRILTTSYDDKLRGGFGFFVVVSPSFFCFFCAFFCFLILCCFLSFCLFLCSTSSSRSASPSTLCASRGGLQAYASSCGVVFKEVA